MAHRNCWGVRLGVPKRYGIGSAEYREFCEKGDDPEYPDFKTYAWPSSDILLPDEIELARQNLDEKDFEEQYNASWVNAGGAIFHAFDDRIHVKRDIGYDPSKPIIVGSDFNVDPMCWGLCQQHETGLHVFQEITLSNANTQGTLSYLYGKYKEHKSGWAFFGDATGRHRKSAATSTDYLIIAGDKRFEPKKICYPKSNPARKDRYASCNALFKNAAGVHRLFIAKRCKRLIRDLKLRSYKEGAFDPDDSEKGMGHISDAIGYVVHMLYPLKASPHIKGSVTTSIPKVA
jgi:hypothetical protein